MSLFQVARSDAAVNRQSSVFLMDENLIVVELKAGTQFEASNYFLRFCSNLDAIPGTSEPSLATLTCLRMDGSAYNESDPKGSRRYPFVKDMSVDPGSDFPTDEVVADPNATWNIMLEQRALAASAIIRHISGPNIQFRLNYSDDAIFTLNSGDTLIFNSATDFYISRIDLANTDSGDTAYVSVLTSLEPQQIAPIVVVEGD